MVCFAETWKDKRHHYLGQCENSRVCGRWKIRWQTKCLSGKYIFHIHASTTKCRGIKICTCPYVWNDYDQTFTDGRLWCVVVQEAILSGCQFYLIMAPWLFLLYTNNTYILENCVRRTPPTPIKGLQLNFQRWNTLLLSCVRSKVLLSWVSFYCIMPPDWFLLYIQM